MDHLHGHKHNHKHTQTTVGDPSIANSLAQAITIAGMSTPERSFWLPALQAALPALLTYAASHNLSVPALQKFNPTSDACTPALNKDFETINQSVSLGGDGVWPTVFSTYASLIPWWLQSKKDLVLYTFGNMKNQVQFLSQSHQNGIKRSMATITANMTGTFDETAITQALSNIQNVCGAPMKGLNAREAA